MDCQVNCGQLLVVCLRSILFNIFINDLDDGIECTPTKLADITQPGGVVDMLEEKIALQRDIGRIEIGWQNSLQQRQMQSPTSGME